MARPFGVVMPGHQAAAIDRHQLRQVLVHARAMQALVEVLPKDLPVAVHHLAKRWPDDQLLERPVGEIAGGRIEASLPASAGGCAARLTKTKPRHSASATRIERVVGLVEALRQHLRRHPHQLAAQRIGPGMVGAGDQPRLQPALVPGAKLRAAMPAGVVEGVEPALFVADDQHLLAAEANVPIGSGSASSAERQA